MKKSRLFEFLLVFLGVAFVVSLLADKQGEENPGTPAKTPIAVSATAPAAVTTAAPVANRPLNIGDTVPEFSLSTKGFEQVVHREGDGPLLIVLTATGCRECLERISQQDVEAYKLASKRGVRVWNLLVFHGPGGVTHFMEQYQPAADQVLADASSEVSVRMLGGSDQTCWLLIDSEGRLAYRGPVDLDALEKALSELS